MRMTGFLQDVRLALRRLGKGLGFTLATVAMLALSICANGTVFSWIESTLLNPVPGALRTGELVTLLRGTWNNMPSPPLSYPDFRDLRGMNQSFSGMQAFHADWAARSPIRNSRTFNLPIRPPKLAFGGSNGCSQGSSIFK